MTTKEDLIVIKVFRFFKYLGKERIEDGGILCQK